VIDRLGNVFVVQSYCLGADKLLPHVFAALKTLFSPCSILKKSDSSLRELEGLKEDVEVIEGELNPPIEITQGFHGNKLKFLTDPLGGQKTGFFFDQRENRVRLTFYAKSKTVLDAYSYGGGFGLYAAFAGAKSVTCADSSESACDLAKKNFEINGLEGEVLREDVETLFGRFRTEKRKFDIIILDPPAFAKSKKNVFSAIRKYGSLNQAAMACLPPGGILFSCSCSHHVGRKEFIKMIAEAAWALGRTAKVLEMRGQGRDHPLLASMPETEYLKCAIVRVD
jgi:23S rRNA (cytosine1962-C5)-methyltransferase